LHDCQLLYLHGVGNRSPHTCRWWCSRLGLAPCARAHAPVGAGGRSSEAETCHARRRLVGIPLVGIWWRCSHMDGDWTSCSVGLDRGPQPSSSRILAFTLSMVLGYLVFKENPVTVKGALIWALVNRPLKLRLTCTLPMSPSTRNINLCFILFFLIPSMHAMHFSL
jgi:hypothetical protein